MGATSIIARRLENGYVQYGWSGNGGYFRNTGARLLEWYNEKDDDLIDYLFSLGQMALIGEPESEQGGHAYLRTYALTGEQHYLGKTDTEKTRVEGFMVRKKSEKHVETIEW